MILSSRPTTRIEVFMFRLDIAQGIQSVPVLSVEFSIVCHGQIYGIVYPPLSLFIYETPLSSSFKKSRSPAS